MPERDIFTPHPRGPIQHGEERAIVASVDRFWAQEPHQQLSQPEQTVEEFPEAPPHLIRRFHPRQPEPQNGESWIPWDDLPEDLFWRMEMADECKRKIYQAHGYDKKTGESTLTPEAVQGIFEREHPCLLSSRGTFTLSSDFDLHDVYVCAEATLLEFYAKRERYGTVAAIDQKVNEQLLAKFQAALTVIGQALPSPIDQG